MYVRMPLHTRRTRRTRRIPAQPDTTRHNWQIPTYVFYNVYHLSKAPQRSEDEDVKHIPHLPPIHIWQQHDTSQRLGRRIMWYHVPCVQLRLHLKLTRKNAIGPLEQWSNESLEIIGAMCVSYMFSYSYHLIPVNVNVTYQLSKLCVFISLSEMWQHVGGRYRYAACPQTTLRGQSARPSATLRRWHAEEKLAMAKWCHEFTVSAYVERNIFREGLAPMWWNRQNRFRSWE